MSDHSIGPLRASDRSDWLPLWMAYLAFYKTELSDSQHHATFDRLSLDGADPDKTIHGLILRDGDGVAQGLTHYLYHANTWTDKTYCYLSDLFVTPESRGKGYGEALILAVDAECRSRGCGRLYWTTAPDNATARRLYDKLAITDRVQYKINY